MPYKFVKWVPQTRLQVPLGVIRISPYGLNIPMWLINEAKEKGFDKANFLFDKENNAILIKPSNNGTKLYRGRMARGMIRAAFNLKQLIECTCKWDSKLGGWVVDLKKHAK